MDDPSLEPDAIGVYYNRNRAYSPQLGRFLGRDPNETALPIIASIAMNAMSIAQAFGVFDIHGLFGDGLNLYEYQNSDPVNLRDPLGLSIMDDVDEWVGDYYGDRAAAASAIMDKVGVVYNVGKLVGSMLLSFIPGANGVVALAQLALGQITIDQFLVDVALSLAGAGGAIAATRALGLVVGRFVQMRRAYKVANTTLAVLQRFCFAAGTLVILADGSVKPIEDVGVGDLVVSNVDPHLENGAELSVVTAVTCRIQSVVQKIVVDVNGATIVLRATSEHPFYVPEFGMFVEACALEPGTHLLGLDGHLHVVVSNTPEAVAHEVFNLSVHPGRTYFVTNGEINDGILVHNTCSPEDIKAIARGHAWTKHMKDWRGLGIHSSSQLEGFLQGVASQPGKQLARGRIGWFERNSGTVLICDPKNPDRGTAFIPDKMAPLDYFNNLK